MTSMVLRTTVLGVQVPGLPGGLGFDVRQYLGELVAIEYDGLPVSGKRAAILCPARVRSGRGRCEARPSDPGHLGAAGCIASRIW
jgi:hypothetical protein